MTNDERTGPETGDLIERRERTVSAVLARIAGAPAPFAIVATPQVDLVAWARPAMLAAAVVIAAAIVTLARRSVATEPQTLAEALGLSPDLAQIVTAGSGRPTVNTHGGTP